MVWTYLGGASLSFSHIIPCLWSIQIIGRLFLNPYFSCFLYVCSVCLRRVIFQVKKKKTIHWLKFYYPKEYILFEKRFVFQTEIYTFRIFIPSLCCFFFLSFNREDQFVVVFFSRGARGHAVVIVNDPFSDLPFFGSEEFMIWDHKSVFGFSKKNPPLDSWQVDFREAPNLFSREVFCPVLSPAAAILENGKTLRTSKGWTFYVVIHRNIAEARWWRCRSDFDFKFVLSKISFLLARSEGLIQSDLSGVDFRSQIRGDTTGRTSNVRI